MVGQFISPDDSRWREFLARVRHDVYHLPEYISFAARHEGGKPCAFFAETDGTAMLVPLLIRALPEGLHPEPGLCDALTPYGYPGPLLAGSPAEGTVLKMLQAFVEEGRQEGIVSSFWRLHPLLSFPMKPLAQLGVVVEHGSTIFIDLSRTADELWHQTSHNHQRGIKKLHKNGFVAVRNDWRHWQAFIDAYRDTMRRVNASQFYFFSDRYFQDLKTALGERLELWTALSPEGEVAGAALFMIENGIVQFHLGATVEKYFAWSPLKLLLFEVRLLLCAAEQRVLHLGGGFGGKTDSLYAFKSQFSPLSATFYTYRSILLPTVYDDLVLRRGNGKKGTHHDPKDYFPRYRDPSELP